MSGAGDNCNSRGSLLDSFEKKEEIQDKSLNPTSTVTPSELKKP
jgi:hypothetical protein